MWKYFRNPALLIGFGTLILTLVIFFAQGGFGKKMTVHAYLYLIGLIIGGGMIAYGLIKQVSQDRKGKQTGKVGGNLEISKRCTGTLRKLHERTLKLKDKAVRQYLKLFRFNDFWTLTNNLMNVVSKEEDKALIEKVKKGAGKKKLSKKAVQKHQQIEDLFDALRPAWGRERSLTDFVAWSNEVDKLPNEQNPKYEGISKRREKDKRWRSLFNELNDIKLEFADIFADKDLEKMVNDYLDYSYLGASLCLVTDLFEKYCPPDYLPAEYVDSGAYRPFVKVQTAMTQLLKNIANRIDELRSVPKTEG